MEERDQALIESYLANELSPEQNRQVEQRAMEDNAFMEMLNAYRTAVEALKQNERDRLKERFKARDKVLDRQSEQPAQRVVMRWAMAAAAVLLLGFIGWKYLLTSPGTGPALSQEQMNQLFTDNFSPFLNDMSDPTVRGDSASALDQFNIDYWTGHYQDAINHYKSLDSTLQQNRGLQFRYANALLASQRYDEARDVFQKVAAHGPSLHSNESTWYLALIEIHQGDVSKARSLLNTYRRSMNPLFGRQADNLLKALGK